ncbi:hypothetical protein NN561_019605 [Cricetulus griseus]
MSFFGGWTARGSRTPNNPRRAPAREKCPWGGARRRQGRSLTLGAELGGGLREWPGGCGEAGRRSGAWPGVKGAGLEPGLCGRRRWGGAELLGGRRSKGHQLGRGLEAETEQYGWRQSGWIGTSEGGPLYSEVDAGRCCPQWAEWKLTGQQGPDLWVLAAKTCLGDVSL